MFQIHDCRRMYACCRPQNIINEDILLFLRYACLDVLGLPTAWPASSNKCKTRLHFSVLMITLDEPLQVNGIAIPLMKVIIAGKR
jgi:hypothetical protein